MGVFPVGRNPNALYFLKVKKVSLTLGNEARGSQEKMHLGGMLWEEK